MSWLNLSIEQKVMIGTSLLGAVSGIVGSFAVLRRRALVGDMLAHAALPGVCLAFLVAGSLIRAYPETFSPDLPRNLIVLAIGATATGLLGIFCVTLACRWTRTKEDAAIGIVLSSFFGAGMVLKTVVQKTDIPGKSGLDSLLLGKAATLNNTDLAMILVVAIASLVLLMAFYKEFKAFSFDPEFTQSQGWPALLLDLLLMGMLTTVTMVGLPAVGVVLIAAMLITPGAAARFWTDRLGRLLMLAAFFGALMGVGGTLLSSHSDLPTGPLIVLSGTAVFLVSMLFAPKRGVLAEAWRRRALRQKTSQENLLRSMYELSEDQLAARPEIARDTLFHHRTWTAREVDSLLRSATRQGLLARNGNLYRLTPEGVEKAAAVTRLHRLWELFLIERANIAADHVDRDADDIEHFLSPELVKHLEARLAVIGRLPAPGEVPSSPHTITPPSTPDAPAPGTPSPGGAS